MTVIPTRRLSLVLEPKKKDLMASITRPPVEVKRRGGFFRKDKVEVVQDISKFKCWGYSDGQLVAVVIVNDCGWTRSHRIFLEDNIYPLTIQQALFLGEDVDLYEGKIMYDIYHLTPVFYGTMEDVAELAKAPEGLFARV